MTFRPILTPRQRELTRHVLDVIHKPASWTRGKYARASNGSEVPPTDPRARRWCLAGAMEAYVGSVTPTERLLVGEEMDRLYPALTRAIKIISANEYDGICTNDLDGPRQSRVQ